MLESDWLTTFWPITQKPEFCQLWDWWWNINNNISFHFRLFPEKTNDKIFQKIQKTYLWLFWTLFAQIWAKIIFPGKKNAQSVFKYSNYLLTDNGDFIEPSVGRGPIKDPLSDARQFLATESPSKNDENIFYFMLKTFFFT